MSGQGTVGTVLGAATATGVVGSLAVTGGTMISPIIGVAISLLVVLFALIVLPKIVAKLAK